MKKVIQIFSGLIIVLSIIFFLYGTIKLARAEEAANSLKIDSGNPGITIEAPKSWINKEKSEIIIGVSVVTLISGYVGFSLSSAKN